MYNVLIVDDEASFITHIKTLINWNEQGYFIVGTASNGQQALDMIASKHIDIVLTDMRMPVMDGAELISQCSGLKEEISFVALSGFKDFEYVRKSLKSGAVDYLIKYSLSPEILLEVLEKAHLRLQSIQNRDSSEIHQMYSNDLAVQIFKSALHSRHESGEEIEKAMGQFAINPKNYFVFIASIDCNQKTDLSQTPKQYLRYLQTAQEICQNILEDTGRGIAVRSDANEHFMLICSFENTTSRLYLREQTHQVANRVRSSLKKILNLSCSIVVSSQQHTPDALRATLDTLEELLELRFYKGNGQAYYEQTDKPLQDFFRPVLHEEVIANAFKQCDSGPILLYVNEVFALFEKELASRPIVDFFCIEACNYALSQMKRRGFSFSETTPSYILVQQQSTLAELRDMMSHFFVSAVSQLCEVQFPKEYSAVTQQALRCIVTQYSEDLSLDTVAQKIGINSAYLSRIFKKDMQKGFVEYLSSYRVTAACELIWQNLPLKEVAEKTGFSSYNYFFKVFKESTGMTPQEFKKTNPNNTM